jgi:hypothetical protein
MYVLIFIALALQLTVCSKHCKRMVKMALVYRRATRYIKITSQMSALVSKYIFFYVDIYGTITYLVGDRMLFGYPTPNNLRHCKLFCKCTNVGILEVNFMILKLFSQTNLAKICIVGFLTQNTATYQNVDFRENRQFLHKTGQN